MLQQLERHRAELAAQYQSSARPVRYCHLDDLLPAAAFEQFALALPALSEMTRLRSLGERKFVSAALDKLAEPLRNLVKAFTDPRVVAAVAPILGVPALTHDESYYNGGLTIMAPSDYMRPHLDNSHDKSGKRPRRVVMLYYLSPIWRDGYGGNLGVWQDLASARVEHIEYRPNRLVLLETSEKSWHSIDSVLGPYPRANLTTYLYDPAVSDQPPRLTRFKAWPREPLHELALNAQFQARSLAARLGLQRFRRNPHIYAGNKGP